MKRVRGIIKAMLVFLIAVIGLLLLTFLILNLPFFHSFVTQKVNKIFTSSGIPVHINSVTKVLPWSVYIQGVIINGPEGDTIVYAEKVKSGLKPLALTKKKLILKSVYLEKTFINILRNRGEEQLNIAAAFSSGKVIEPVDQNVDKKPLEISFTDAEVKDLKFMMTDSVSGIYISQDIRNMKIETKKMSLTEKTILVKSLGIEGVTGNITLNQVRDEDEKSEPGPSWNLGLDDLSAIDINFLFDDQSGKMKIDFLAGEILFKATNTDLNKKIIDLEEVSVSRTSLVFRMAEQSKNGQMEGSSATGNFDWDIRGDLIKLEDIACRMSDYTDTLGYNPLSGFSFIGLGMKLFDLQISKADVNAGIENLKFDLGNGFSMRDMNGKINSQSGNTSVELAVETAGSRFNMEGFAGGNIFDIIEDPAVMTNADLTIRETEVSLADLFYFKPDLQNIPGLITLSSRPVTINGDIKLDGSVLTLPAFSVSQSNSLGISFQGQIDNIYSPQKAVCDLKIRIGDIDNIWLRKILQEVNPAVSVPDYKVLSLEAAISDSLMTPDFSINLKSDLGKIELSGSVNIPGDKFSLKSHFDNVRLGAILENRIFGSLTGSGEIIGSGVLKKSLAAGAVFRIDSIGLKDHIYKNTVIEGKIQSGKYSLRLNINDPALTMDMSASVNASGSDLSGKASGIIDADLYSLHLFNDSVTVRGVLSADFRKHFDEVEGGFNLSEMKITSPRDSVAIQNFTASLKSDTLSTSIIADADFLSLSAHINRPLNNFGQFVQSYRNYLLSLIDPGHADSLTFISDLPLLSGKISLDFNKALRIFVPDTTLSFRDLSISFNTKDEDKKMSYSLRGRGLKYKFIEIGNLSAILTDSAATIDLNILADTCIVGPQQVSRIDIQSHFYRWKSLTSFSVIARDSRVNYNIEISSALDTNNIIMRIPSGQITLNSKKWKLESPEFMKVNLKTRSLHPTLVMHSDSSLISFVRNEQDEWQDLKLVLNNVTVSSLLNPELLPGKPSLLISGFTTYSNSKTLGSRLTSDMKFSDVSWYDLTYKNIAIESFFQSDSTGNYNFEINTSLDTSEIRIKGERTDVTKRNINAVFKLIPVSTIQPFVKKYLSDLGGNISGDFNLSLKDEITNLTGDLFISNGNLRINTLNSTFRLPDDRIKFTGKNMEFNNFRVLDSLNNELIVDGSVDFSTKGQVSADLVITSSNLQVLNRKDEKNATFYGNVFIDSKLSIQGAVTSPVLKGKIKLARGTDIYLRQSENLNLSESGNVLTFESRKSLTGQAGQKTGPGNTIYNKSSVESIVEIDPATKINIEISKKMFNIDVVIQGGGALNYNMLVNSQVNMNGRYEIGEGGANLKMVGWPNKAFRLTKGGSIRWDGKLDDPDLKLEAINRVKSSYINPVDGKERYVDFDVTLKITNRLSDMDISFTISTQDQYLMSIINTLSPDEQMRQAITILLFETVDLPGISTSSNYMSEQVNQMVAAQLNSLTKTTIKGIDISFGIDTYTQGTASGGEQTKTSLSYEVKRNLLNDRAKVEFSGIASGSSNQSGSSNTSLNNFSFEYRIDSAATKFLKVYNEHSYEDVFEGDVVKTGVGFTYRKNYPTIRDIWRKKEKVVEPVNPEK